MNIDSLARAVGRLKDSILPADSEKQERLRYIEMLHNLSDDELDEARYQEEPSLRPSASREELIENFLSIDIDSVPESLLKPGEQLSKVDYRNLRCNHIERDRVHAGTVEALQRWYVWKTQVYGA